MVTGTIQYQDKSREYLIKELKSIEALINQPKRSDIAVQLFGLIPLQQSVPGLFNDLTKQYKDLLDIALNEDPKTKELISDELHFIGDELCTLKAGASDVLEIHSIAMELKSKEINPIYAEVFAGKARLILLELMGYLISDYRKHSLILKSNQSSKTT